ncbi:MAG: RNA polymerase sigma factor [Pseudomonadota bacterium]
MKTLSDRKLITLVQATGDGEAFSELAKRHGPALLAFLRALGGDEFLAEEAAQESLILAYTKLAQFRSASSFRTWLFRIAYREHARLAQKDTRRSVRRQSYREQAAAPPQRDSDLSLDMEKALAKLSDGERSAIILCDAYGLSHAQAAEIMRAPLGSVKTYVRRARRKMQDLLAHEEKGTEDG